MKLLIYSLRDILFQDEAMGISCQTEKGEITILDHHEPLIGVLTKGVIKIRGKNSKDSYLQVKSGFFEVRQTNEVRCIVEQ